MRPVARVVELVDGSFLVEVDDGDDYVRTGYRGSLERMKQIADSFNKRPPIPDTKRVVYP